MTRRKLQCRVDTAAWAGSKRPRQTASPLRRDVARYVSCMKLEEIQKALQRCGAFYISEQRIHNMEILYF